MSKKRPSSTAFAYITIGLELAITVLIFVFGGHKLDEYLVTTPLFVSIGAFLGMGIGFYALLKRLNEISKIEKGEKDKEKDEDHKRVKWM